jgi:hypothetical protein
MMRNRKRVRSKPINWAKAIERALAHEKDKDALRAVELIRELYWLVIIKHGKQK